MSSSHLLIVIVAVVLTTTTMVLFQSRSTYAAPTYGTARHKVLHVQEKMHQPPPMYDDGDDDDISEENDDIRAAAAAAFMLGDEPHMELPVEKKEMLNKVIAALLHVNPHEMKSYVEDNVQDPYVKKAILTKKVNVCHFKLCNLGRRRRR